MAHFKPNTDKNVIFYGNSLFFNGAGNVWYGFEVSNYVRTNQITKRPIFDYSFGGIGTAQLITDFPTKVAPYFKKDDIFICWETINDLNQGKTLAQTIANTKALCALAQAKGYKVYTLTCMNVNNAGVEPKRIQYNTAILADTSFCDGVIDIASISVLNAANSYQNTTYYNADGVHLTTAGYNLVANKILETLNTIL